ncbi:serine/threonine protein kinase [Mucilaginibacter sp. PPCGB 2223]|uniref:PASTA domain-containing protein n=1 Tax=Mucilaginibacter sp. PPCGB 2223 TaxID=1886027 RepID=UPI0008241824|nr:PASTA domain-containing protein [Mucilaginibacter sp. PPCGB 2223]OCX53397.1 serine/threonine protein kinase [Mucilaginibacter sp. PPCGB 2223]
MSKFVDYLKTKQFYINLGAAIGSVIVIITIIFLSLGYYTRHGSGIPVPALVGTNIDQATALLDQQGFKYQIDSVYVADKAPGTIIIQDPDAGTNVKENRTIYLTVVKSLAPNVSLPDLTQDTYNTAVANIKNFGLKIGDTTYAHDIARDRVLQVKFAGQIITPGTKIPKGSRIDLVLGDGKGASEVIVPDLVGQDFDAAKFVISNSGLVLGTVDYGVITDSTKMVVESQVPAKGDSTNKVSIGTRINLKVVQKN